MGQYQCRSEGARKTGDEPKQQGGKGVPATLTAVFGEEHCTPRERCVSRSDGIEEGTVIFGQPSIKESDPTGGTCHLIDPSLDNLSKSYAHAVPKTRFMEPHNVSTNP